MPKATSWLLPFLMLIAGACAPTRREITISVAPGMITAKAPPYIGAGDSLRVIVHDAAYANRYVVRDTAMTLVALDASAMTGDASLKVMNLAFAPSVIQATPRLNVQEGTWTRVESPMLERTGSVTVLLRSNSEELKTVVDSMNSTLERLRARVRVDRGEYARIMLLTDTSWFMRADALASDNSSRAARAMLYVLSDDRQDSIIPRFWTPSPGSDSIDLHVLLGKAERREILTPDYLHAFRARLEQYGRRLDLFRASLPADPPAALADTSSVPNLMATLAALSEDYDRLGTDRTALLRRASEIEEGASVPLRPQMLVVGLNLDPVLATRRDLLSRVDNARIRLDRVNRGTVHVVSAANQLPRWTTQSASDTVFTSVYAAEKEVRVVVTRRNRFAPWGTTVAAAATETKPATTTATSAGTTVTTVTTVTQGGAATPQSSAGATPAAAAMPLVMLPKMDDTVAVLTIPVLQRYRFRLGVGMIFSSLRSAALETREDSVSGHKGVYVQRVGRNEHRLVPVALLSTTLYPLEGRFVDGRARRYPFHNPSVSLQSGLSLQNPTEHLYAGLAIEPVQGIEIGGGLHFGYVKTTEYQSGDFVPLADGAATASRWKTAWAGSVTFDATTFVRAFGGLLGL